MSVQLMRRGRYSWYPNEPTDYTGRWKIKVINGHDRLYLECFDLEEIVVKEEERVDLGEAVPFYTTHKFLWWEWKSVAGYTTKTELMPAVTKIRAKVEWVHESDLSIRVVEEFVNQCESCDDAH